MASHGYPRPATTSHGIGFGIGSTEKDDLMAHLTRTINALGATRRLRKLAVEAWFDTQWYELEITVDFSRLNNRVRTRYRGEFVQGSTFKASGKCLRINVRMLEGSGSMRGWRLAEIVEEEIRKCRALREAEVDVWVSSECCLQNPADYVRELEWTWEVREMLREVRGREGREGKWFRGRSRLRVEGLTDRVE